LTDGIIQKVFKKYHLEHISGYYFITDKEFNDVMFRLKKKLIAEIKKALCEREICKCDCDMCLEDKALLEILIGDTE
jgi:hypothetical protein